MAWMRHRNRTESNSYVCELKNFERKLKSHKHTYTDDNDDKPQSEIDEYLEPIRITKKNWNILSLDAKCKTMRNQVKSTTNRQQHNLPIVWSNVCNIGAPGGKEIKKINCGGNRTNSYRRIYHIHTLFTHTGSQNGDVAETICSDMQQIWGDFSRFRSANNVEHSTQSN